MNLPPPHPPTPWSSRSRRFHANLAAFAKRVSPAAADLIQKSAAEKLPHHELFLFPDGNFQIRYTRLPEAQPFLGGFQNHKAATNLFNFDKSKTPLPLPIAFDGLSHGHLFLHILTTTQNSFLNYSCALYVLESDPLALAFLFHAHDLTQILPQPRIRFFFDPSPEKLLADFQNALSTNRDWSLPQQFVRCYFQPRPPLKLQEAVAAARAERDVHLTALNDQMQTYYADKTPDFWKTRYEEAAADPTKPLRILGITSRYTTVLRHSMAEMQAAIDAVPSGPIMQIAMEPDDHSLENPYLELLSHFKPDLIFQISRLRYENAILPKNVPFLCWDQDNLSCMRTPQATASLDPLTFIAGHAAVFGYTNLRWPRENCIFVHPAGATFRYHNGPIAAELLQKHACDISYISNASTPPETFAAEIRQRWSGHKKAATLFDELAAAILADALLGRSWDYIAIRNRLRATAQTLEPALINELTSDLHRYADRCFRQATLLWVSNYCSAHNKKLNLYGRGWENHPTLSRWAAGIAAPGEETRAIYRASKINLQLIDSGFIHSRSLDGLAAGGFFLARQSAYDAINDADVRTLYQLAQWVDQNDIRSDAQLDAVADPTIRRQIASTRAYFARHEVFDPLTPCLHIWAQVPASSLLFPQLPQMTFHNEESFARAASHFLENPREREAIAEQMRKIVLEQFSYPARWNTFLQAISSSLGPAATPVADVLAVR